jgi:hypothetical protein
LFGSSATIPFKRSSATSSIPCVWSYNGTPFHLGNVALKSGNLNASGQFESVGVPNTLNILKI